VGRRQRWRNSEHPTNHPVPDASSKYQGQKCGGPGQRAGLGRSGSYEPRPWSIPSPALLRPSPTASWPSQAPRDRNRHGAWRYHCPRAPLPLGGLLFRLWVSVASGDQPSADQNRRTPSRRAPKRIDVTTLIEGEAPHPGWPIRDPRVAQPSIEVRASPLTTCEQTAIPRCVNLLRRRHAAHCPPRPGTPGPSAG
jgi:hypothetical protein